MQENDNKPHFGPDLGLLDPNSSHHFFFKNLALSVTRYHGQLSSCTIFKKTTDPFLRKFSDGWMDESDFIGRYLINTAHPNRKMYRLNVNLN